MTPAKTAPAATLLALSFAFAFVPRAEGQALRAFYEGPNHGDRMGYPCALGDLDGDGADEYAVGASRMPNSDGYVGVVTVYSGLTGAVLHEVRGDADAKDFGVALGAIDDWNGDTVPDFIVGDPSNDDFGSLGGSISIYSGLTGAWLIQVWGGTNDQLGTSVCGVADLTGDGRGEAAYGIPGRDLVVVGSKTGSSLTTVWAWYGPAGSTFGRTVADAGDVDADGVTDVVVGAPGYDPSGKADVGRAYVYSGATGGLLWAFTGSNSYDYFAWSVDGAGDLNGDGHADIVVGCDQDDTKRNNSGKAVVYSGADAGVLFELYGISDKEYFGQHVRGVGDVNGDGTDDLGIASPGWSDIGRITVFSGVDGSPFHDRYDHTQGERWGRIDAGDFDGDGDPDLILGTPEWVDSIVDNGRVEVYRTSKAAWENYGTGWAGKKGVPSITGVDGPWIARSASVFVENSSGLVGAVALLLIGVDDASIVTNKGGTLLVTPMITLPFVFPYSAGVTLGGALPDDPALCDVEFFLQALELDAAATKGMSFTDGLKGRIGYEYP